MNTPEFKIEKGIPIPSADPAKGITEVFRKMQIGDSVVVPKSNSNLHACAKACGVKIKTRTISDTETRLWKVG